MMLIFCMTMMFCVSCPLITPFGCMYFITKHYVDRHNIFYVYKPSKINKRVHATAISFVILSTVVLQFFMTIFRLVFRALYGYLFTICVCIMSFWQIVFCCIEKKGELLVKFCYEITQLFLNLENAQTAFHSIH